MKELTTEAQLSEFLEASHQGPVFVFKHSTTCPISAAAHRRVSEYLDADGNETPPFYLVKVIESRPLSNAIARESAVQHASPQLILFHDGRAEWDASHGAITAQAIRSALAKVAGT